MSDRLRVTGLNSGMDTESIVTQLVAKYQTKVDKEVKNQKKLEYKQNGWKDMNADIYSFYSGTLSNMRWSTSYLKLSTKSSSSALSVEAGGSAVAGIQSAKIISTAKAGVLTSAKMKDTTKNTLATELKIGTDANGDDVKLAAGTYKFNGKDIEITDTTTVSSLTSQLSQAGVNASYDEKQGRFYINAKDTGEGNDFKLDSASTSEDLLKAIGCDTQYYVDEQGNYYTDKEMTNQVQDTATIDQIKKGEVSVRVSGSNAVLQLNGTQYESDTNAFSINGLTMKINNYTSENISISTSKDTDGVYDAIKEMFNKYNTVINKMCKMYNEDAGKYEPLTDEEKSALTESEQDKWEEKLKDSCLSKDARLREVMQSMREVMTAGVTMDNGKKMYLADFGIATLGYFDAEENERYAYHIDGNPDDETTSGKKDKLRTAITTDPELVAEFFGKLSSTLYKKLTEEMATSEYSSIYKVYNDKQMKKEYVAYDKKIKELEDKMSAAEDKYYSQFAAMEKAMAKVNAKQNAFSSYLGG